VFFDWASLVIHGKLCYFPQLSRLRY
jgi:hypothetical protein